MLGWEFPPHISGGLGTACHGIVQALSRADVDVLFVIPRARGDEDAGRARVLGANQIPVEERTPLAPRRVRRLHAEIVDRDESIEVEVDLAEGGSTEPMSSADPEFDVGATEVVHFGRDEVRRVETRAIDSLLSPYLDARGYRERLLAAARLERRTAARASGGPTWSAGAMRQGSGEVRAAIDGLAAGPRVFVHPPASNARSSPSSSSDVGTANSTTATVVSSTVVSSTAASSTVVSSTAVSSTAASPTVTKPTVTKPTAASPTVASPTAPAHQSVRMWIEEADVPVPDHVTKRLLDFSGSYGGDLFGEVARYALAVESLARRESFDVIHAHDWMAVPAGVAAKRASGKKLVFHVHALEHDRSGDRPNERVRGIEQLGLDEADIVVCVSHYTKGILKRHYRVDDSKLRVVHNALTQRERREQVHAVKPLDEPIVLFLGRITAQKGPEYFLEAAVRVARVRPDVKFVVAGSGDRLGSTIELAAKLGLARNTHFTGFLAGADVERMYAMADVYVMPSVSEPFGIAPLEAMALDVPVIVSRQSGVSEVLRSALKVDYWDVQGIAEKILAVLAYPELSRTLQDEGKVEALAMRWDAPAAKLKDAYTSLAGVP